MYNCTLKIYARFNEEIITSRLIDDGGGGDIGGRDGDGVVVRGAQNVSEPLRSWGLLGAGGLIRSHGSLARSIPHSPNLLYVLNLQQQKSCDRLKLLVQIKQYEKSWIIGVYCPPMGI